MLKIVSWLILVLFQEFQEKDVEIDYNILD